MVRSRGGCPNCKRRKRKCDETRPECRACQTRGIQCEGYNTTLKWTNGIASRGRFARAAVPDRAASDPDPTPATSSSHPPTIDDPQPRVSSISSSPAPLGTQGLGPAQIRSASQPGTQELQLSISSLTSSPTGDVIDPKQQLFRRFIHTGMNMLYNTESQGWLKGHFVAMAERSPAFFNVCGAIQAYLEDGLSVSSMELVDHALQTFRSELESRHESYDASTVSAGLLICTQCLLQARPWTIYLQLMADLYHLETDMGRLLPGPDHDPTVQHTLEVLSIMDMEPMVIGRRTPSMGIWRHLRKVQDSWQGGRMGGIEVLTGMPRTLLDVLADIRHSGAQELEARLWAWPGDVGLYAQCILWDCWRYTAVLHVRRIERKETKMRSSVEAIQHVVEAGKTTPFPSREVILCRLVASVYALHRAIELPENKHLLVHNGLMYPLVIGSLEVPLLASHPEWKQVFDDVRTLFTKADPPRLINSIVEVLDEAWKEGSDTYDIEEAARSREVEIPVF
ncbi:uncharacterized protein LY79DRAFT_551894 [Colletotrichum navitas]|uniref:Zn(2)-C6 fungal-type domain-containing protein n=1 Tax=Colletotrichum navitas TaxID=681940 RepID=A0AAD8V6L1_9PEZI|nr:uncharacterized protein LY79DRAFT_551894 [Colletotrichum navitas]KAK1593450.1 hypothetical protein LY79DRAFT_551894 [Colletotrichum navitas]